MVNLRPRINLDGNWQFWTDPSGTLHPQSLSQQADFARQVQVPAPWQSYDDDLRFYTGAAWYRRTFEVPANWIFENSVYLQIGAADYLTEVYINDQKIGEHEGGYLPFEFDITNALRGGENTLTIRVDDPAAIFPEIPHGKQGWYGPLSGIWQSVNLEMRHPLHVTSLTINVTPEQDCVEARIQLSGPALQGETLEIRILDPQGQVALTRTSGLAYGASAAAISLTVPAPLWWSPAAPNLYTFSVTLATPAAPIDTQEKNFGFRTITARDGKLYLNGELFFMRGALDQDYYPETISTLPSLEFLEDEFRKAKELGLNLLRCHIKVADPRYYEVADRMGMLIWTELPNWSFFTEQAGRRGRETYQGILQRDGHHPSIIIWTVINENWGTDLANNAAHRSWVKETYQWLKAQDPTRLVVDNSPCVSNFHVQSDLDDYHFYRAIPDQRLEWDQFVDDFANRADFTYSPNGDISRSGSEPLIVSEFGNWGLPDADLIQEHGKDPWWFETGLEWSEAVVYPKGVKSRFKNIALDRVFGSWKSFITATQHQQYESMKYEIESMRRKSQIRGYVITELTDVHWECNGLLDMRRNRKSYHHDLKNIVADTIIVPLWTRLAFWAGETVEINLQLAHGAGPTISGGLLSWQLIDGAQEALLEGSQPAVTLIPGETVTQGSLTFTAPQVSQAARYSLRFTLTGPAGEFIAANHLELAVYPLRQGVPQELGGLVIYTQDAGLRKSLERLGYRTTTKLDNASLAVAANVTPQLSAYLHAGGRMLVLADRTETQELGLAGIKSIDRQGTPWFGDWASSFSWLNHNDERFASFPGGPLLDATFDSVLPKRVMTGFRDWDFRGMVRAGMIVGWVHKPAALIAERRVGDGRAIFNTLRLRDEDLGQEPVSTYILDALLAMAAC